MVRFVDDEGSANVSISFYDHGIDLYLSEEEFGHFVEALSGLQPLPVKVVPALSGRRAMRRAAHDARSPPDPDGPGIALCVSRARDRGFSSSCARIVQADLGDYGDTVASWPSTAPDTR